MLSYEFRIWIDNVAYTTECNWTCYTNGGRIPYFLPIGSNVLLYLSGKPYYFKLENYTSIQSSVYVELSYLNHNEIKTLLESNEDWKVHSAQAS